MATLDQVLDEIRRNNREATANTTGLARLAVTQDAMAADIHETRLQVAELHKCVNGNGEGLKSRMARLEQCLADKAQDAPVKAARISSRASVQVAVVGAGAAVLGSMVSLLVQALF
jgi:hypothetical protein